ncbi:unnamed protein product [Bursaphelenchus xylophilus]|uniref:(pine wood nematode) hypothetical protein n=1 Tax=Bursaphelenchus xylophilus TaxID=6326 RepID=A0A1I7RLW0_BURXY|nr:unnamed protein product [Bursaphelenchus xylophilus]CAG9106175.1 unnamed protein product [Bursaphelenchus xylophilus]
MSARNDFASSSDPTVHADKQVRFTLPERCDHIVYETYRVLPCPQKKSIINSKIPMDEVEMLRHGFKNHHGHCHSSDSEDDLLEQVTRRTNDLTICV